MDRFTVWSFASLNVTDSCYAGLCLAHDIICGTGVFKFTEAYQRAMR